MLDAAIRLRYISTSMNDGAMDEAVKRYLSGLGKKGGKTGGQAKVRGDSAYYKRLSAKAAVARKRKARQLQKGGRQ